MNITTSKVKRLLEKDYGWILLRGDFTDVLIKDILKVIDLELIKHKGISIRNKPKLKP